MGVGIARSVVVLFLFSGCAKRDSEPVPLDFGEFSAEYAQMERRVNAWANEWDIPAGSLPSAEAVFEQVDFYEFDSTPDTTCYFTPPSKIEIGGDEWESGCVPHEIGHAALWMAKHPCWGEFEHEDEREMHWEVQMTPAEFHSALMGYCYATSASQTSGGRTVKRNAAVGGSPNSNHLQWLAADVVYDGPILKATRDRIAARFGLEVIEESDHDHLEPRP